MAPTYLVLAACCGFLYAEESHWKITGFEAAEGRPDYSVVTLRNTSEHALELGEHWHFKGAASANACILRFPDQGRSLKNDQITFAGGPAFTLFSEPCHGPKSFLIVEPGTSVRAMLPRLNGFKNYQLGLVLTRRDKKVVAAVLEPLPQKEQPSFDPSHSTSPPLKSTPSVRGSDD